nr:hypothetical protein [Actinacidiphila soli]
MHKVFADLGLNTTRHFDGTEVRCTIRLDPDEHYLAAVDERGRTADTASLRPYHAARLAPLTDRDVHDLITAPRCAPLLFGHRGSGQVDLGGLE